MGTLYEKAYVHLPDVALGIIYLDERYNSVRNMGGVIIKLMIDEWWEDFPYGFPVKPGDMVTIPKQHHYTYTVELTTERLPSPLSTMIHSR